MLMNNYKSIIEQIVQQQEMESSLKNVDRLRRLQKIELNKPCLSVFSLDSKLYRALIEDKNDLQQVASVRYIDYGNSENVRYEK